MGPSLHLPAGISPQPSVRLSEIHRFMDEQKDADGGVPYSDLLGLLTGCTADLISVQQTTGKYLYVSENSAELFGWSTQELLGRSATEFAHENDVSSVRKSLVAADHRQGSRVKYRLRCRSNRYRWVETRSRLSADGRFIIGITRDIHDQVRQVRKLKRDACLDPLTGLYNRRSLGARLATELERSRRDACTLSVAFIDCDRFKLVNDMYGHESGDKLLRSIGRCIDHAKRSYDIAGRWGGDEFLLLLPGTDTDEAAIVAARIRELLATAHSAVTLSSGISSTEHADSMEQLLIHADAALYKAKKMGGNRVMTWASR